jgi:hypothetical protein
MNSCDGDDASMKGAITTKAETRPRLAFTTTKQWEERAPVAVLLSSRLT